MNMKKVIFVCRGNVIRSQICKALYNKLSTNGSSAEGYGFEVEKDGNEGVKLSEHEYLSNLVKIMKEYDMDISNEISKQLIENMLRDNPKVIIMGSKSNIPDWMDKYDYEYWNDCTNEKEKNKDFNLNIPVPKFGDEKDIRDTITFLKQKVKNLIMNN